MTLKVNQGHQKCDLLHSYAAFNKIEHRAVRHELIVYGDEITETVIN